MAKGELSSALEALVRGEHGDPFAVLGPHRIRGRGRSGIAVRALLPAARAARVLPGGGILAPRAMACLHPDGLFEACFPEAAEPFPYQIEVDGGDGSLRLIDDPYRFPSTLGELDLQLLGEGTHYRAYEKLGAHPQTLDGTRGVVFAVWAPNARRVSVVGDWNGWDGRVHPMRLHPGNGVWELFVPDVQTGARYKFEILARSGQPLPLKSDPYATAFEPDEPRTASVVWPLEGYPWGDQAWMADRAQRQGIDRYLAGLTIE